MVENLTTLKHPMAQMPGFEALQRQQQAFLKSMMAGWKPPAGDAKEEPATEEPTPAEELAEIKKQLASLQTKLSRLGD
jgi:polyhydroxyalkanoate synthesis regulator protein